MRLIEAQQQLLALKQPVLETSDVSACLKISISHATKILERLTEAGQFVRLMRGKWATSPNIDPLILPEYLTKPFPSYVSLQTALFYHGMISQIPHTIYAVTLTRTRKFNTPLGTISVHRIHPDFFFGYDWVNWSNVKMASPEKALLDVLYLASGRSYLFKVLPELEIPAQFDIKGALKMIYKIPSKRLRTLVEKRFIRLTTQSPKT